MMLRRSSGILASLSLCISLAAQSEQASYAAGDSYYWQGKRMPLHRSLTEYAVQFAPQVSKEAGQALIEVISPGAMVSEIGRNSAGAVSVVRLKVIREWAALEALMDKARAERDIAWVTPVFLYGDAGNRLVVSDEILFKLKQSDTLARLWGALRSRGLLVIRQLWGAKDEYLVKLNNPKAGELSLEAANALFESGLVEWAQPNFIQEYQRSVLLNDPKLDQQWHLIGSREGVPTQGQVYAPEAWDLALGDNPRITIAVIDDGVQRDHPDLADNIFTNPMEISGNEVDDDNNGFIDDLHGWDFINNDKNPNPFVLDSPDGDFHGTAVAGVAAARGDNDTGVSGVCPRCNILPIKIFNGNEVVDDATISKAIRYAASLADVVNSSWGGGAPSNVVQSALQDANTEGRGGNGVLAFFAAGNRTSEYALGGDSLPAGTHRFEWKYLKDSTVSSGEDTAWLRWVRFPGNEFVDFESGLPEGWSTEGAVPWSVVQSGRHADEGQCFVHAAKSGVITHDQKTIISVVKSVPEGNFDYYAAVSSQQDFDGLKLRVDLNNDGSFDLSTPLQSGTSSVEWAILFPAAYPEAISIGASSDKDCRADYSQIGPELDFVAPSSAGPLNQGITTTDLIGTQGYNSSGDYVSTFGGTSSATPLAAGIAALVLSRDPNLTRKEVRGILKDTVDKIGPKAYDEDGRNDRYGFGRLNAGRAVQAVQ